MIMSDVYAFWRKCHKAEPDPSLMLRTMYPSDTVENPQPGLWKINVGGGYIDGIKQPKSYVPMQIWLQDAAGTIVHTWQDGLTVAGLIDGEPATADQIAARWLGAKLCKKAERDYYFANAKTWPSTAPDSQFVNELGKAKAPAGREAQTASADSSTSEPGGGGDYAKPGHNIGNPESYDGMRAELLGEVLEAKNYYAKHAVVTKDDADKCENWRKKIAGLAKVAEEHKRREKIPLETALSEIEKKWASIINEATGQARVMQGLGDKWIEEEKDRRRQAALAAAKAEHDAREAKRKAEEEAAAAERARIEEQRQKMLEDDPIAALTGSLPELPLDLEPRKPEAFNPVVADEKILIGTQGTRRSARAPAGTAAITDLKAAAAFFAEQKHPDLIALIQKLADRACKSRASIPGILMSWEKAA